MCYYKHLNINEVIGGRCIQEAELIETPLPSMLFRTQSRHER